MKFFRLMLFVLAALGVSAAHAERITVAAASDLKFALGDIVSAFLAAHPGETVEVVYGSSGRFNAQIRQGAPYDLFFSADIAYPRALAAAGYAAAPVETYAFGRIVLWSTLLDARQLTLASLAEPRITRIAIANPKHAPYGKRAEEALRAAGLWERIESKLVYGDSITHTAQFVQTGNAQVGIIALALALSPELSRQGGYWLIPDDLHEPLEQGFMITRRAQDNALARRFAAFMHSDAARETMRRYGFVLPADSSTE